MAVSGRPQKSGGMYKLLENALDVESIFECMCISEFQPKNIYYGTQAFPKPLHSNRCCYFHPKAFHDLHQDIGPSC